MSDVRIRYTYPDHDRLDVKVHVDDDLDGSAIDQAIRGFTQALVVLQNLDTITEPEP